MEAYDKLDWGASILALLIVSMAISALISIAPENPQPFKKKVEIRANDNIGEIVSAVENIGRNDIEIDVQDEWWGYGSTRLARFFWSTIGSFFSLGFLFGVYYLVYCLCRALLKKKTPEMQNI